MKGRDKCELLNEIRQKIADENNIEFTIYDCTFEGDCTGTCPKCESELKYLESELEKKQNAGEKINLKNIFKLDGPSFNGCPIDDSDTDDGFNGMGSIDITSDELKKKIEKKIRERENILMGDIAVDYDEND